MDVKALIKSVPIVGSLARKTRAALGQQGWIGYRLSTLGKIGGVHPRICPLCGYEGLFTAFGDPPRWDAKCPKCGSLERHRLLARFLHVRPELISGRLIHFAPEPSVTRLVEPLAEQYQSADLFRSECDLQLNLEQMDLHDASIDVFVVSHVLEHVNDRKALGELHRCLKPGGVAIIMVPIVEAWDASYENDGVTSEKDRNLHFGQFDHVRYYGADLRQRIREAGFDLEEFTAAPEECVKYGLMRGETVFVARRAT